MLASNSEVCLHFLYMGFTNVYSRPLFYSFLPGPTSYSPFIYKFIKTEKTLPRQPLGVKSALSFFLLPFSDYLRHPRPDYGPANQGADTSVVVEIS